jgi:hypothetical protein
LTISATPPMRQANAASMASAGARFSRAVTVPLFPFVLSLSKH